MDNKSCLFCDIYHDKKYEIILENNLFYSRFDGFPVSKGHAEIISKKHIESFFDLTQEETLQLHSLIKKVKGIIDKKYHPDAYNIGVNDGEEAGRTIHHLHIHLIPRYKGDVENPKGGVRNTIPGKGNY